MAAEARLKKPSCAGSGRGEALAQPFDPFAGVRPLNRLLAAAIGILLPWATSTANAVGYAGPLVRRSVQYAM